jgi:hypothetical protein
VYAGLELKFSLAVDFDRARSIISANAGSNAVEPAMALRGTALASVPDIAKAAVAAEQIRNAATVIYFGEGNDTVRAHIESRSLADARAQCSRITRQLAGISPDKRVDEAQARLFVQVRGTDEALLEGQRVSYTRRLKAAALEKFIGKFLPAGIAFVLAAALLPGTSAVTSAMIAAVAAIVGAFAEALLAAAKADEWNWKWKDVQ